MIVGEFVRGRAGDGEIDEGDDRQKMRRGVIDRDFVGRAKMLKREDVDIGQQQIKALDHEDRQRGGKPGLELVGLRPGRALLFEPAVEHQQSARCVTPRSRRWR